MEKNATRKNPIWEGLKAAASPFAKGVGLGAVWGVAIGVVTASAFALFSIAATGTMAGAYASTYAGGTLAIMGGFTTFPVQMFFNGIINAGVRGVQTARGAFSEGYTQAKSENAMLDLVQGKPHSLTVSRTHHRDYSTQAPALGEGIKEILENGPAESHHDMAKRMADLAVGAKTIH